MLVATFGPTTAWVGRTITWDGSQFVLEGQGRIPAAALVDYDQHGHLHWASAELRSWAWAYAHWEAGAVQAAPPAGAARAGGKKPFPAWAIVLIVVAVLLPIGGMFAAILIPAVVFSGQHAKAEESAVKEGVHSIQIVVQTWAVDHDNVYPPASQVNQVAMSDSIEFWPANPYTGAPMTQGTGPGDFGYEVSPDGRSFRLVGYGEDGNVVIATGTDVGSSI